MFYNSLKATSISQLTFDRVNDGHLLTSSCPLLMMGTALICHQIISSFPVHSLIVANHMYRGISCCLSDMKCIASPVKHLRLSRALENCAFRVPSAQELALEMLDINVYGAFEDTAYNCKPFFFPVLHQATQGLRRLAWNGGSPKNIADSADELVFLHLTA